MPQCLTTVPENPRPECSRSVCRGPSRSPDVKLKCRASVAALGSSHVCAPSWDLPCCLGVISPLTWLQVEHGFSHPLYRAGWKEGLPMGLPGGAGLQPNRVAEEVLVSVACRQTSVL